jgi:putative endonuclease
MRTYFVYILLCIDKTYYTGVTNCLERRLYEHNSGLNEGSYTSLRLPVELVYYEEFKYILNAIEREKQIKNWSQKKKKSLISKDWNGIKIYGKKKF